MPAPKQMDGCDPSVGRPTFDLRSDDLPPLEDLHQPVVQLETVPPGLLPVGSLVGCFIIVLMVVLAEITLIQASGFAGPAVFFPAAAFLLLLAIPRRSLGIRTLILAGLLTGASCRMAVHGSWWLVALNAWLLAGFALSLRHQKPFVFRTTLFALESLWAGWKFFAALHHQIMRLFFLAESDRHAPARYTIGIPVLLLCIGIALLLSTRAELRETALHEMQGYADSAVVFLQNLSLAHSAIWLGIAWVTAGLFRPVAPKLATTDEPAGSGARDDDVRIRTRFFTAHRNAMVAASLVVAAFAAIEGSEHLGLTGIPGTDLDLAGYGGLILLAGSLTMTTLLVCCSFSSSALNDFRINQLRLLTFGNLSLNLLLTTLVFRSLKEHVERSGIDSVSVLAILAIVAAAICYLLLVSKVVFHLRALWVLRRFGWTFGIAVYLFLVLPIDTMAQSYNVAQILNGNTAPLMTITTATIPDETLPVLLPLCDAREDVIRDGATAILSARMEQLSERESEMKARGWTAVQWGTETSYAALTAFADSRRLMSPGDQAVAMERLQQLVEQQPCHTVQ